MNEAQTQTIGKYQVLGLLGRGSMGLVYKARDPEIGRLVAIKTLRKILPTQMQNADMALERFRNEARSAGNLRHSNIITIFEISRDGDTPYIVMDYVEGESLDAVLERKKTLPIDLTLHYLTQIAAGLDYAHSKGIIHKDIKPANIFVDSNDNVFILDFGIAQISASFPEEGAASGVTALGTPGYMSPEQILNEKLDARTDIFSLAIVAFQCLSGKRPFPGSTFSEVVGNILGGKPLLLSDYVKGVSISLEAEFDRALARDKEQRFVTAGEMAEAFVKAAGLSQSIGRSFGTRKSGGSKNEEWRPAKTSPGQSATNPVDATMLLPVGLNPKNGPKVKMPDIAFPQSSPGEMFASTQGVEFSQNIKLGRSSTTRILTVFFGIIAIGLGVALLAAMVFKKDHRDLNLKQVDLSGIKRGAPIGDLVIPQVDPVPPDKKVADLTNKELLGVLVNDKSPESLVLEALQEGFKRNVPEFVDAMVTPLQSDSYVVRVEVTKLLAQLGDRRIVPRLMLLLDDHDPLVRGHAAKALGALGDRRALGYLGSRLVTEEVPEVKLSIKNAVEKINGFPVNELN